jgi:hypothetical protein
MIQIPQDALREGCERSHDLLMLNHLRAPDEAAAGFAAVYEALGLDSEMRERLQEALRAMVPVEGLPVIEATMLEGMASGVLVGLLIADSALPSEELDPSTFPTG